MKIKEVLQIQDILGQKLPIDMSQKWMYHSNSTSKWIDIVDLDIIHAIRIIRKHIGEPYENWMADIGEQTNDTNIKRIS